MHPLSRLLILIAVLVLPPIPFLWWGWPYVGSPQGFGAVLTILLSYGGWLGTVAAFVQITGIPWREWFQPPKSERHEPKPPPPQQPVLSTSLDRLHSIPPPLPDFIGRANEIEQLVADLTPHPSPERRGEKGAVISGVAGMGGIGKTQLAYVVAHRIAAHYPDAQILIDCRGTAKQPPPPTELMREIIHAFDPTADLRQITDAEIAALYRALLNGKRALILLDNAADAAQVEPLLPPPGCALLITSRRHFVLPGLSPLRLDVMPPAEATALLRQICPRLAGAVGAADEIAHLCGYLPLALRIAGSTLAEHTDLTPARYIERLRAQRLKVLKAPDDPEGNVEATLEASYALLTPDLQTRWRALAVFPASFDVFAAASVWDVDEDKAFDTLSELVRLSLLDYTLSLPPVGGRYSLHDLLRDLADARLSDAERDTAHLQHALLYLGGMSVAQQLYRQGGNAMLRGLALFDTEWQNIRAGQAWAAARMDASEDAARLCNYYVSTAVDCLALRLHPRERIAWLEAALAAARKLGEKKNEGNHLGNLGLAYAALGETRKAIEYYEQALAIAREIGDRYSEGIHMFNLGVVYEKPLRSPCRRSKSLRQSNRRMRNGRGGSWRGCVEKNERPRIAPPM